MGGVGTWSFFVFITLPRNEKQAVRGHFGLMCAHARSELAEFFGCLTLYPL